MNPVLVLCCLFLWQPHQISHLALGGCMEANLSSAAGPPGASFTSACANTTRSKELKLQANSTMCIQLYIYIYMHKHGAIYCPHTRMCTKHTYIWRLLDYTGFLCMFCDCFVWAVCIWYYLRGGHDTYLRPFTGLKWKESSVWKHLPIANPAAAILGLLNPTILPEQCTWRPSTHTTW